MCTIMPDVSLLFIFMSASLVLLVTPGPAVLYIIARGIEQGRKAGIVSSFGLLAGSILQVSAAAFGVSVILVSSDIAFSAMKYAGAAYLIYLGFRTLLKNENLSREEPLAPDEMRRIFYQGLLINILNPKTVLFFFAFLPQFVDVSRGSVTLQMFLLGGVFNTMGICVGVLYALLAGTIGNWLRTHMRFLRTQRFVTGGILITLGVAAALSGSGRK
jgi:threonine/homoserine/homoserine lactone efflux protein